MNVDALLKRYFPLVLLTLIGMAAYFQASGMGQLVAASVATVPPPGGGDSTASFGPPRSAPKDATPILARNAFDSVTGPIIQTGPAPEVAAAPIRRSNSPYDDPPCDSASVTLITAGEDVQWSFAAIQDGGGETQLRRVGDTVGNYKVEHIGWYNNAPDPRPRVWLADTSARCQLDLSAEKKAAAPAAKPRGKPAAAPRKAGRGTPLPEDIASKIQKVGENQWNLDKSVIDEVLGKQQLLMKSVRMRPGKDGGMRLSGIRSDSLLGTLGMRNGDQLKSINGFDMSDPEKALEAYAKLKTATSMQLVVERGGTPLTLDYKIK